MTWHRDMYDLAFAKRSIDSEKFHELAAKEAAFLIQKLALPKGAKVLDVPCGTGRHAALFAKQGWDVTGLDINSELIAAAQTKSPGIQFHTQDMRDLSAYHGKFDAVLNLFTSFGYFDTDRENAQALQELVACLKPGGTLAMHLIDRDWLLGVFQPVSWSETEAEFWLEARKYDPASQTIESNTVVLDKDSKKAGRYYHRLRLYSQKEITELLGQAGLSKVQVFGNFEGAPFEKGTSTHPIYLARR